MPFAPIQGLPLCPTGRGEAFARRVVTVPKGDAIRAATIGRGVQRRVMNTKIELEAIITCPHCGFAKHEQMLPDT